MVGLLIGIVVLLLICYLVSLVLGQTPAMIVFVVGILLLLLGYLR
jgi:C4-dicarboxylate transporter